MKLTEQIRARRTPFLRLTFPVFTELLLSESRASNRKLFFIMSILVYVRHLWFTAAEINRSMVFRTREIIEKATVEA